MAMPERLIPASRANVWKNPMMRLHRNGGWPGDVLAPD
jgi:hypothetical protein